MQATLHTQGIEVTWTLWRPDCERSCLRARDDAKSSVLPPRADMEEFDRVVFAAKSPLLAQSGHARCADSRALAAATAEVAFVALTPAV